MENPSTVENNPTVDPKTRKTVQFPYYSKATQLLFGVSLFFFVLYALADILIPLCFAGLIAILLNPIQSKLRSWGVPKVVSIAICLLLVIAAFVGIIAFISSQLAHFADMGPELKEKAMSLIEKVQQWIAQTMHVSIAAQEQYMKKVLESGSPLLRNSLSSFFGILSVLFLVPVYIFLLLFYKPLFLNFFYETFDDKYGNKVEEILRETKSAIQSYVSGLMIELVCVAVLNSSVLLIIGVPYAILLGVIGALLNIIPYIGGILAIAIPIVVQTITGEGWNTQLYILGGYLVVQFIDNYLIVPKVVAGKVSINAFISIFSVLLGGALWGVPGMFLSAPFVAILKIISDRVPGMKPWGKLFGNKVPRESAIERKKKKARKLGETPENETHKDSEETTSAWTEYNQATSEEAEDTDSHT